MILCFQIVLVVKKRAIWLQIRVRVEPQQIAACMMLAFVCLMRMKVFPFVFSKHGYLIRYILHVWQFDACIQMCIVTQESCNSASSYIFVNSQEKHLLRAHLIQFEMHSALSHLQSLLTNTNNLIAAHERIELLPLPHSSLVPDTAVVLRLLVAGLLELELAVLAAVDSPQSIHAVLLERTADLPTFELAVAAAAVVVWRKSLEGVLAADGGDGADSLEEEVLVPDEVTARTRVESRGGDGCSEGEEDWKNGWEVHG